MSLKVSELVWKHSKHKGSTRLVLLAIARYANDDGTGAWPSLPTLKQDTGLSIRSVQYALHELRESGELLTEEGAGPKGCNLYTILIGRPRKDCVSAKIAPTQETTEANAKNDAKVTQPVAPDPSVKPSKIRQGERETRAREIQRSIPDDFTPTPEMLAKAKEKYQNMNIWEASETWMGSMRANTTRYRYTDWNQAWWNGLRFAEQKGLHRRPGGFTNGEARRHTAKSNAVTPEGRRLLSIDEAVADAIAKAKGA